MSSKKNENLEQYALLVIGGLSLIGVFVLIGPFLGSIILAFITAIIFYPVYRYLGRFKKLGSGGKTLLVSLLLLFVIVLPIALAVTTAFNEVPKMIEMIESNFTEERLKDITDQVKNYIDNLDVDSPLARVIEAVLNSFADIVYAIGASLGELVLSFISNFLGSLVPFFTQVVIFVAVFVSILPNLKSIRDFLRKISPLDMDITNLFIRRTAGTVKSMVLASVVLAIMAGFFIGFLFWIFDLPFVGFVTLTSIVLGFIPLVGPSLITIPAAIVLVLDGQWVPAIVILAVHFFIVNNLDLVVRPYFMSEDEGKIHPVVLGISVIGGIAAFGLLGVIYGPLIVIIFATCLEIYAENYFLTPEKSKKDQNPLRKFLSRFQRKKKTASTSSNL